MGREAEKKKLEKAQKALDKMDNSFYQLYCELMGIDRDEAIDRLLISIDTDELLAAICDIWFDD